MFCEKCGGNIGLDGNCTNPLCESNRGNDSKNNLNMSKDYSNEFSSSNSNNFYYENSNSYSNPNAVTEADFIAFVGEKNTEYYLDKFERYQSNQNFASWNWAAFFLGMFWILYRKLYKLAGILFGINLLSVFLIGGSSILNLVIMIGCGTYGNLIYVKDSIQKIENIKRFSSNISHMDLNNRLIHNGGVSFVGPIILLLLITPLIIITVIIYLGLMTSIFF
ncbi:DUF2628 domain-containing protein [Clostridium baratii]|uniref:DUF2628 domain-containing protein n=1 Tax=Clostridium baratii TaxID=1561 RepID=UPI003D339CAD